MIIIIATRIDHVSVNTSQLSTPTPPFIQQGYRSNGDSMFRNDYDDPTVLDTRQLGSQDCLARNEGDGQYTTMHSNITRNTPTSTISNNSSTRHAYQTPQHHYDVPKVNSDYDEPTALGKQV